MACDVSGRKNLWNPSPASIAINFVHKLTSNESFIVHIQNCFIPCYIIITMLDHITNVVRQSQKMAPSTCLWCAFCGWSCTGQQTDQGIEIASGQNEINCFFGKHNWSLLLFQVLPWWGPKALHNHATLSIRHKLTNVSDRWRCHWVLMLQNRSSCGTPC